LILVEILLWSTYFKILQHKSSDKRQEVSLIVLGYARGFFEAEMFTGEHEVPLDFRN
jgi:hypothetical protein